MKRIDKAFPALPKKATLNAIPKWVPTATVRRTMNRQMPALRRSVGAPSRDITTRPILMQDHIIDGHAAQIRVRRYFPASQSAPLRAQLFFHGGGFFAGTLWAVEEYCKALCDRADCIVLSVEYHLAPEHPFPEGLMDCYCALKWAWESADLLHIDRGAVSISGDSAGGNFAAVIAQILRDEGEISLASQVLIYPMVDFSEGTSGLRRFGLDRAANVMMDWYLGTPADPLNPRVSPLHSDSLRNLPRTLVVTAQFDPLQPQAEAYAHALDAAGVDVTWLHYLNTYHGFIDQTGTAPQGSDLASEVAAFLTAQ